MYTLHFVDQSKLKIYFSFFPINFECAITFKKKISNKEINSIFYKPLIFRSKIKIICVA